MNKILKKTYFSEKVVQMVVEAPLIAKSRKPGNFVIVRVGEKGERMPLTISDADPNYNYEYNNETEDETLPPEKQNLRVILDSKQRKGKTVTLVQGFVGREDDLKELAKLLKNKCGVGGSVKDGEIIIQGEVKEKVLNILRENKYRAK